jgi:TRAP-type C4-dicarboxylate transport system permease small subunit
MLKRLENIIFGASHMLNYVSGVALVAMMCMVFVNVILRMTWRPILGTYEITALLASVTISFALAHCATTQGHVAVSLFTQKLSKRMQAACDAFVAIIGTGLFVIMSWQSWIYAFKLRSSGEVSMTLEISFYPFILGMAFGFLMLALVNLVDLLNSIAKVVKR